MVRADLPGQQIKIYCLKSPDSDIVWYVGKTRGPLEKRLYEHIQETGTCRSKSVCKKCAWIRELASNGMSPTIHLIEICDGSVSTMRERHWILHYMLLNSDLANGKLDWYKIFRNARAETQIEI